MAIPIFAGVELGGTKTICSLGRGPGEISDQIILPTYDGRDTLAAVSDVLSRWQYSAIGIASFGPIDLDPRSPGFGTLLATPKPGWAGIRLTPLAGTHPYAIDTDVNAAAIAEGKWGNAETLRSWAYITVGTGIGVGSIVERQPLRGLGHSEAGHLLVPRLADDDFAGHCPFHGDCVEGLASGAAIAARTGQSANTLSGDHPVWRSVSAALAALCHNLILTSLPERILFGGGIAMGQAQLLPAIRARLISNLAGYGSAATLMDCMDDYISYPKLGDQAGPLGSIMLAQLATSRSGK